MARNVPYLSPHRSPCVYGVYHKHQIHLPYNTTLTWLLWKSVNRHSLDTVPSPLAVIHRRIWLYKGVNNHYIMSETASCWKVFKECDSVGWNFCLIRQHGSANTNCSKTFIVLALQKSIFIFSSVHCNCEWTVSLIRYTFNQILNSKPWLYSASSVPRFLTLASYNVSLPVYVDEKLENCRTRVPYEYIEAIRWLLSCHETNVTLQHNLYLH